MGLNSKMLKYNPFIIIAIVFLVGCEQKPQVRHYTEVIIEAPDKDLSSPNVLVGDLGHELDARQKHSGMTSGDMSITNGDMSTAPMMPTANSAFKDKLTWAVPSGWIQQPGSAMRLATLHPADDSTLDCSIVSLPGGAGGLEANLKRWIGQINLDITDERLTQFISASHGHIFDFTQLQKGIDPSTKSMIAAMIELDGTMVFVKMTGTIDSIHKHKDKFLALVKSVRLK
jgi:hypothetical protein